MIYPQVKLCIKLDTNQSTITYFDSMNIPCDDENICNVYFCKLNNNKNNSCPYIYFDTFKYTLYEPIRFTSNYLTFDDYDSQNFPLIYIPIINVTYGI